MAGTPEEDLLGWLEREEERLGFADVESGLTGIEETRALFYDELGYDMTEEQFDALKQAQYTRYDELPAISITRLSFERPWGVQAVYRDVITGRFVSKEDVFDLLTTIR